MRTFFAMRQLHSSNHCWFNFQGRLWASTTATASTAATTPTTTSTSTTTSRLPGTKVWPTDQVRRLLQVDRLISLSAEGFVSISSALPYSLRQKPPGRLWGPSVREFGKYSRLKATNLVFEQNLPQPDFSLVIHLWLAGWVIKLRLERGFMGAAY